MIIQIFPPQNTPHDRSHANQTAAKSILIGKTDLDAAYRCIHENSWITSTSIAILDNLALL